MTPNKNKSVPLNLSINTTKSPHDNPIKKNNNRSEEKLNLSVDIAISKNNNKNLYDNNLRLSRISEEKLNNSVSDIGSKAGYLDQFSVNQMNGPNEDSFI